MVGAVQPTGRSTPARSADIAGIAVRNLAASTPQVVRTCFDESSEYIVSICLLSDAQRFFAFGEQYQATWYPLKAESAGLAASWSAVGAWLTSTLNSFRPGSCFCASTTTSGSTLAASRRPALRSAKVLFQSGYALASAPAACAACRFKVAVGAPIFLPLRLSMVSRVSPG